MIEDSKKIKSASIMITISQKKDHTIQLLLAHQIPNVFNLSISAAC
jgi:hypothetical protein